MHKSEFLMFNSTCINNDAHLHYKWQEQMCWIDFVEIYTEPDSAAMHSSLTACREEGGQSVTGLSSVPEDTGRFSQQVCGSVDPIILSAVRAVTIQQGPDKSTENSKERCCWSPWRFWRRWWVCSTRLSSASAWSAAEHRQGICTMWRFEFLVYFWRTFPPAVWMFNAHVKQKLDE